MPYLCEYLPRVNTATVVASPPIASVKGSEGKLVVTDTSNNCYPVVVPTDLAITKVSATANGLSLAIAPGPPPSDFVQDDHQWSVNDLKSKAPLIDGIYQFQFRCRHCHSPVINSKDYKFKDMPSEYWYELMDFWHCHKPDNHQQTTKKYEAIRPRTSDVLVGSYYLMVDAQANANLNYNATEITCANCDVSLGSEKLNMWTLELSYDNQVEIYPISKYWYSRLVDKSNMAIRKVIVEDTEIWVVNIDIGVSISSTVATPCAKILYRPATSSGDEENLPLEHSEDMLAQLNETNGDLPQSAQETLGWRVSYLGENNPTYIS